MEETFKRIGLKSSTSLQACLGQVAKNIQTRFVTGGRHFIRLKAAETEQSQQKAQKDFETKYPTAVSVEGGGNTLLVAIIVVDLGVKVAKGGKLGGFKDELLPCQKRDQPVFAEAEGKERDVGIEVPKQGSMSVDPIVSAKGWPNRIRRRRYYNYENIHCACGVTAYQHWPAWKRETGQALSRGHRREFVLRRGKLRSGA